MLSFMGPEPVREGPRVSLVVATLVLFVCDVIGGFIALDSGVDTWNEAWGFETEHTVPLPVGVVQLLLAWLAAVNARPPVGMVSAGLLSAFCLISVVFGAFDGDLTGNAATDGWTSGGVLWGLVLLAVTAVVGLLAADRARQLYRLR